MKTPYQWLDDRTGIGQLMHEALYERIPGGARWRYVWGSTLVFAFFVQLITGIALWAAYSPGSQSAWESVYYIQHEMQGGWLLRGVHHFMAQAMVVLLAIHVMQVVIAGAYRAPREMNFWLGLVLLQITLGLALTGYLLPWDQKGYWATNVATNLMTLVPVIGEDLQKIVLGGSTYGNHTLTRFFALHAGVLPGSLILFLAAHLWLFRRHGITTGPSNKADSYFWPDQVFRDAVACLAVLTLVLLMTIHWNVPAILRGEIDTFTLGAELMGPAEPSESYAAARPEWYFLALFQLLKPEYGISEFVGAIVVPGALMGFLFAMPIIGHWKLGHRFNIVFLCSLLLAAAFLTWQAIAADRVANGQALDPKRFSDAEQQRQYEQRWQGSRDFMQARAKAHQEARRMVDVISAQEGIPATGALALYRRDPVIQGPKLFRLHCSGCHSYVSTERDQADVDDPLTDIRPVTQSASNLYRFGSRDWVAGILNPEQISSEHFLGMTAHRDGEMTSFVNDNLKDLDDQRRQQLSDLVVALSAEAELPGQTDIDARSKADGVIDRGKQALVAEFGCTDCHRFHDTGELGTAPDLTNYASAGWLRDFIANPGHERFYGERNDRMQAYAADPLHTDLNTLQPHELDLLVRWLRGDVD